MSAILIVALFVVVAGAVRVVATIGDEDEHADDEVLQVDLTDRD